jgi:trimeric autotransporter adhesin
MIIIADDNYLLILSYKRADMAIKQNEMKLKFSTLILFSYLFFSSCQKNVITPDTTPVKDNQKPITTALSGPGKENSTNDSTANVNGFLKMQLIKDASNKNQIVIDFNPSAKASYISGEDAPQLQGFGQVSLSSLSSDNVPLTINALPLFSNGQTIALKVDAKADGSYQLKLDSIHAIPATYQIWLKDNYKKDSLDFRQAANYTFSITKADTASFGSRRFQLIFRDK